MVPVTQNDAPPAVDPRLLAELTGAPAARKAPRARLVRMQINPRIGVLTLKGTPKRRFRITVSVAPKEARRIGFGRRRVIYGSGVVRMKADGTGKLTIRWNANGRRGYFKPKHVVDVHALALSTYYRRALAERGRHVPRDVEVLDELGRLEHALDRPAAPDEDEAPAALARPALSGDQAREAGRVDHRELAQVDDEDRRLALLDLEHAAVERVGAREIQLAMQRHALYARAEAGRR